MKDDKEIAPPSNYTVDFERKPVLYQADGKPLIRQAGFVTPKHSEVNMGRKKPV
jgi:hypothetical protein